MLQSNPLVLNHVDTTSAEFDLQCKFGRNIDDGRIQVEMEWRLTPEDPITLEAYLAFFVFAQFTTGRDEFAPGIFVGGEFVQKEVSILSN